MGGWYVNMGLFYLAASEGEASSCGPGMKVFTSVEPTGTGALRLQASLSLYIIRYNSKSPFFFILTTSKHNMVGNSIAMVWGYVKRADN